MSVEKTYVLGDVEVKLTGRSASKPLPSGKKDFVFEVTPVDERVGVWKKWVRMQELFIIE